MEVTIMLFSLIGILIGILSSLFGFGGGLVVVSVLFAFLPDTIPSNYLMHTAIGTSLAVMIINSLNSTYNHAKKGNVQWPIFKRLAGYIAIGSLIGGIVAIYLNSNFLRFAFIALLVYVLLSSLIKKTFTMDVEDRVYQNPPHKTATFVGIIIGFISTLLGVGGSTMTIPYLRNRGMRMLHAVALATPLGLPIAIVGTISFLVTGLAVETMPSSTVGFIYIPALIGFTIGGFIGVPIGRAFAQNLPDKLYSKIYLLLLLIVIMTMIIG